MIDWRERLVRLTGALAPSPLPSESAAPVGYHGLPVLRRPHWKWHIPLYFAVSGLASGAFAVAAFADASGRSTDRAIARAGRRIALGGVIAALPLLIDDLGRPERFHHMLRTFKPRSPMSVGAWGLAAFGGITGLLTLLDTVGDRGGAIPTIRRCLGLLAVPLSLFLAGYTGVLLAATAVPLWARGRLVWGPLFALSALGSGLAAIELALTGCGEEGDRVRERLHELDITILTAEMAVTATVPRALGRHAAHLTVSPWGQPFWLSVALGQIAPLVVRLWPGAPGGHRSTGRSAIASALTLVGALLLRWTIVAAGKTNADDPAAAFAFHGGMERHS